MRQSLVVLDVSHNDIHICDHLNHLIALRSLNISHNKIEVLFIILFNNYLFQQLPCNIEQLRYLTELDVGCNLLTQLPHLIHLSTLKTLSLHGNRIVSLQNVAKSLPSGIESLDLSANAITDLTEVNHFHFRIDKTIDFQLLYLSAFKLNSLCIIDNPCVDCVGRDFDYRPFLVSICPETLRVVDGFVVTETEEIKGSCFKMS